MKFSSPLIEGTLVKRYKRFLADIRLDSGELITAHCANTGSMISCGDPGDRVAVRYAPSPKRKLDYSLELTKTAGGFIGVNTMNPNRLVKEALELGELPEFIGYRSIKSEVRYGSKSRIDFKLEDSADAAPDCFIEVKNVTLLRHGELAFPDAVTSRGLKHLEELISIRAEGLRAVLLFVCNRPEGRKVGIAGDIDPDYFEGIREATAKGVELLAYRVSSNLNEMVLRGRVPVRL